eukprot:m.360334 g.360334  ORF g.360334 m.360334 type:complete len:85 (+) comp18986_c0_seq1:1196-1450(+)
MNNCTHSLVLQLIHTTVPSPALILAWMCLSRLWGSTHVLCNRAAYDASYALEEMVTRLCMLCASDVNVIQRIVSFRSNVVLVLL